jgi:hypothetical protein
MVDDVTVCVDHQRLRNHVPAVCQYARGLAIRPAHAKEEFDLAHESFDTVGRGTRVFVRQPDEFHLTAEVRLTHLLVLWSFSAARAAPGRPQIDYHDLALIVSEPKTALVERLDLALEDTFGQRQQFCRRRGPSLGLAHWFCILIK